MTEVFEFLGIRGLIGLGVALALSVMLGLQVHKTHREHASAVSWEQKYDGEHAAFQQTIINYSKAADQARQADAANIARVRAEQAVINERTQNEYQARLTAARALAGRLRQQADAAAGHPGSPAAAGVSDPVAAPGSPDSAASEDGLPLSDRLLATEQAIQLDELIKWVRSQVKVDMTGIPHGHLELASPPSTQTESH